VCPGGVAQKNINLGNVCNDDISCTMFEKIDYAFKYRAETCAELLYVLVIYPASNASPDAEMSISGEYVDEAPCFTIAGGIHETVSSGTVCGAKISEE
jgi:hypothetical protein